MTTDQKVVCSNHAGCNPQPQRLTYKGCLEQTEWLGHFSATFELDARRFP